MMQPEECVDGAYYWVQKFRDYRGVVYPSPCTPEIMLFESGVFMVSGSDELVPIREYQILKQVEPYHD